MSNYLQRVFARGAGIASNIKAAAAPPASLPFASHTDDAHDAIVFAESLPTQKSVPPPRLIPVSPDSSRGRDKAESPSDRHKLARATPPKLHPSPAHAAAKLAKQFKTSTSSSLPAAREARRSVQTPQSAAERAPDVVAPHLGRNADPVPEPRRALTPQPAREANSGSISIPVRPQSDVRPQFETAEVNSNTQVAGPPHPAERAAADIQSSPPVRRENTLTSSAAPVSHARHTAPPPQAVLSSAAEIRPTQSGPWRGPRPVNDPSRERTEITIGRVDVQVNNLKPASVARGPRVTGSFTNVLEARYLNRFSLKP